MMVYYVVGRPRSGSTFVGDWIARELDILNAGEVWQTVRTLSLDDKGGPIEGEGRWARPEARAAKNAEICADPFWSQVFSDPDLDPYAALVEKVQSRWSAFVDCSKTDEGIERYRQLGCKVIVVHTVRAYSTWVRSVRAYREQHDLARYGRLRLLVSYIRNNRRLARYAKTHDYYAIRQEQLAEAERHLPRGLSEHGSDGGYERHEMFGTPNFNSTYSQKRALPKVTWFDHILYWLIGAR